jgi:hypothetical protein
MVEHQHRERPCSARHEGAGVLNPRQPPPSERDAEKYRRLAVAVLEQAWADLHVKAIAIGAAELRERARVWFESADRDAPFAFVALCEFLELDAEAVRERVFWRPRLRRDDVGPTLSEP